MSITFAAAEALIKALSYKRIILLNILLRWNVAYSRFRNRIMAFVIMAFPLRKILQLRTFSVAPPDS